MPMTVKEAYELARQDGKQYFTIRFKIDGELSADFKLRNVEVTDTEITILMQKPDDENQTLLNGE